MRKLLLYLLTGLMLVTGNAGIWGKTADLPQPKTAPLIERKYLEPIYDQAIARDVIYQEVTNYNGEALKLGMDIYQPVGDSETERPALLILHGGSFRGGNKEALYALCVEFARRGYVVASADYRVREDPAQNINDAARDAIVDIGAAFRWLHRNGKAYRIDCRRIIIGGESAGGYAALALGYQGEEFGLDRQQYPIAGVLDLYGGMLDAPFSKNAPPLLIIHGTKDPLIPYDLSVRLAEKAKRAGVDYEFFTMDGMGHTYKNKLYNDNLARMLRFMYRIVIPLQQPVFTTATPVVTTAPGRSFSLAFLQQASPQPKEAILRLPEGWKGTGKASTVAGKAVLEYTVTLPENTELKNYFLLLETVDPATQKSSGVMVLVRVIAST